MIDLLDSEGYPTDEFIDFIKSYQPNTMPIMDFVKMLEEGWHFGDRGYKLHDQENGKYKLELHTGGWSGNETTISAILDNFWLTNYEMKYVQWNTGGHYYFEIKANEH